MTVKQEPVSVNWQTLFAVLPVVWIWAFYRIEKLRLALVILISTSFGFSVLSGLLAGLLPDGAGMYLIMPITYLPQAILAIALIRKWSKQWNEKFS